ncbi:MAG: 1-phosphofructokinase [Ruminococcaceae bacterium]|nr:1-phosphofructokinase [Oscillospiraceae bacterium]
MIYTVTLNPALDYTMHLDALSQGSTNRSARESVTFGGKGINVSAVLRELGLPSVVLGFAAGFTGRELCRLLDEAGLSHKLVMLEEGMTRINVKLRADRETEINAGGPAVRDGELNRLLEQLEGLTEEDTLVLAGSVPAGVPSRIYEQILSRLAGKGVRVVVDTEPKWMKGLLPYRPFLVKPNRAELSAFVGRELHDEEELLSAARELQRLGAQNVLVSLGGDGALLLDDAGEVRRAAAMGGKPIGTVGAGDSMVAGFLFGVSTDKDNALRYALAAGGATATGEGIATAARIYAVLGLSD